MSEEAMEAGIKVKVESVDKVEPYDGSYDCLFCTETVRVQPDRAGVLQVMATRDDDDDVYYYICWRLKLEGET